MTRSEYAANVALATKGEANDWTRVLGPSKGKTRVIRAKRPGVIVRIVRAVLGR
jgi:hypothetical protein